MQTSIGPESWPFLSWWQCLPSLEYLSPGCCTVFLAA